MTREFRCTGPGTFPPQKCISGAEFRHICSLFVNFGRFLATKIYFYGFYNLLLHTQQPGTTRKNIYMK